MSKQIYCAECGTELSVFSKAIPTEQRTVFILAPHTCPEETPDFPFKDDSGNLIIRESEEPKSNLSSAFDKFKTVQKINELKPTVNPLLQSEPGDKRPKDQIVDNIAPSGVLDAIKKS